MSQIENYNILYVLLTYCWLYHINDPGILRWGPASPGTNGPDSRDFLILLDTLSLRFLEVPETRKVLLLMNS